MLAPLPRHPLVFRHGDEVMATLPFLEIDPFPNDRPQGRVFARGDCFALGGSGKLSLARALLNDAEQRGTIGPGATIVEATSGNFGIALATLCASRKYRCVIFLPETMSVERRQLLAIYGAEIMVTPGKERLAGARLRAQRWAEQTPGTWYADQATNPLVRTTHGTKTAPEILAAMTGVSFDAFVCGWGTGNTLESIGAAVKRKHPSVWVVAVEPAPFDSSDPQDSNENESGCFLQGLERRTEWERCQNDIVDEVQYVTDTDARATKIALARNQGLLVGPSSGANVWAARKIACALGPGKNVVTMLCDTGERYFSLDDLPIDIS